MRRPGRRSSEGDPLFLDDSLQLPLKLEGHASQRHAPLEDPTEPTDHERRRHRRAHDLRPQIGRSGRQRQHPQRHLTGQAGAHLRRRDQELIDKPVEIDPQADRLPLQLPLGRDPELIPMPRDIFAFHKGRARAPVQVRMPLREGALGTAAVQRVELHATVPEGEHSLQHEARARVPQRGSEEAVSRGWEPHRGQFAVCHGWGLGVRLVLVLLLVLVLVIERLSSTSTSTSTSRSTSRSRTLDLAGDQRVRLYPA